MSVHADAVTRRHDHRRRAARRRAAATGALGAAWLLLVALAPTAQAGPGDLAAPSGDCAAGWVCGWTDPGYTGVVSLVAQDMPRYPETTAYVGFNGGSSVWNSARTWRAGGRLWGRCVTVYNSVGYSGRRLTVRPNQGVPQLPAGFGNIRSNRFHPCRLS
ncbi:peptidase inhibitor family I36 protein [Streptomyces sp. NPDC057686]|uniref:peptidase inhibitor family I36 protein n=1 Tax=Streptomyces sp. NPDC057686 TaxID=3346212 RepID=UPI00369A83D7